MKNKNEEDIDWEEFELMLRLERDWKKSLPRFTDREIIATFPDAKSVIPGKLDELEEKREELSKQIKEKLTHIKHGDFSDLSKQLLKQRIEMTEGIELLKIDDDLRRLKSLLLLAKGKKVKGHIRDQEIQRALTVPIQDVLNQKFRKSGDKLIGSCPLHNEKTPSFFVYLKNNSFYCYGCQVGGDIINLIRKMHNYSFVEAVQYLIHV